MLPDINFHVNPRLNPFSITTKDSLVLIKSLDPNKSHGWYFNKNDKDAWRITGIFFESDI